MEFHGWNGLRKTISLLASNNCSTISGPVIYLDINKSCTSGVNTFYCTRKFEDGQWAYNIVDRPQNLLGLPSRVYWLPWSDGRCQQIQTSTLNNAGVDIFLTSSMSGCHFIGCEKSVAHVAPNSGSDNNNSPTGHAFKQMHETLEDSGVDLQKINNNFSLSPINHVDNTLPSINKFVYGGGEYPPRACVIGIKYNDAWFFAYQEKTCYSTNYAKWYKIN